MEPKKIVELNTKERIRTKTIIVASSDAYKL
jgi:hypothetical protein